MLIFRIEDKNGNGPYSSSWNYYRSIQKLNGTNQPSPYYECIKFKCEQHKFGFIDLNQYQEWFNEKWRFKFKKHNFRLNVYKVFKKMFYLEKDKLHLILIKLNLLNHSIQWTLQNVSL